MSPSASDLGDAVRPDGTLKDASEITWTYDADESVPFPAGQNSAASSGRHVPAEMGAGIRRTTRVSHPSRRVLEALEAEEAEAHVTRTTKRKPPRVALPVVFCRRFSSTWTRTAMAPATVTVTATIALPQSLLLRPCPTTTRL